MKYLIIALLTFPLSIYAQKVEFVGKEYTIPAKCEKVSKYEIECGNFSLSWLYMQKSNIEEVLFNMISQLEKTPDFKYKPVRLLIDGIPSSGFVASFTADHIKYFQLCAAGTVRGQTVLIQGIDMIPFWKYETHNELFSKLITLLPDGDRPKMEMNYENQENGSIITDKPRDED